MNLTRSKKANINKKTLTARVITPESFGRFLSYMPNPDEILQDAGEAISVYRKMQSDSRIKSLLKVAKGAVMNYPVRLEQEKADDAVMAVCLKAEESLNFFEPEKRLLSGIEYGFAAVELVWKNEEGWWYPSDAVLRKPERFVFDAEGRLKYPEKGGLTDLYSQSYKWLVWRHDKDAENPYGTSVLKSCYWPWKFKKAGAGFWLMAAERFSVPSILAIFESSESPERMKERAIELSDLLTEVSSGSGAALANVKEVKTLGGNDALSEFKTLMDWCDTQIAYGIVQQSLAVQEAENGTRAQAEVHQSTFLATAKTICRELTPVLQQIVDWTVTLNFGSGVRAPRVSFDLSDYAPWSAVCAAIDRGVPVSRSALYDRYGLPEPTDKDDEFTRQAPEPAMDEFTLSDSADTGKKKARRAVLIH